MKTAFFSVKNFDKFQHYKDRKPPWIKLYHETFEDYEFAKLPDASKMHLIAIWSLASRYNNKIPYDAEWIAKRINATEKVDLKILVETGFIETDQSCSDVLADSYQDATPEKETETETDNNTPLPPKGGTEPTGRKPKRARRSQLPPNFPDEKAIEWAIKDKHLSRDQALAEAQGFRDYWLGDGGLKADWMATWRGRINRAVDTGRLVVSGANGGMSETERAIQQDIERKKKRQQEGSAQPEHLFLAAGGMR